MEFYEIFKDNRFDARYAIVEDGVIFLYQSDFKLYKSYSIYYDGKHKILEKCSMIEDENIIAKLILIRK